MTENLRQHPAWLRLRDAVSELRGHQQADGSAPDAPTGLVSTIRASVAELAPSFPHDTAYLKALDADLARWADQGLGVPDFLDSLSEFHPSQGRADGRG